MAGHKIILRKNSDNFGVKLGRTYLPVEGSLMPYLCDSIWIEKGVTFEEFFNIIMKHQEEYSIAFYSHLGGIPLSDFNTEWSKPADEITKSGMQKIVITWGNITYLVKNELLDNSLEINWLPEFAGIGTDKDGRECGYGIEFTPLNELKKYSIELIPDMNISNIQNEEKLVCLERGFTVYEVLSAIFYEITFVGNPKARGDKLGDLKDRLEDVKKDFDGEGNFIGKDESKYTAIDEVMKGLKEKISDYMEESGSNEEFDEYGHKKGNKTLDDILKKLNIDKPNEENE